MKKTIKVLNVDAWLLFRPLAVDIKKRLDDIISVITKEKPDIVFLQEFWFRKQIKVLEHRFDNYFFSYPSKGFYNKSGLVTMSLSRPEKVHFEPFRVKSLSPEELIARKGFLIVELAIGRKKVRAVNTHLNCPKKKSSVNINEAQFMKLKKVSDCNTILGGDLNINRKLFNNFNKGFFRLKRVRIPKMLSKYAFKGVNRFLQLSNEIDYILTRNGGFRMLDYRILTEPVVSDHLIHIAIIMV